MPIIKSAKKRVKVSNKAAIRNSKTKRSLKTAVKAFTASLSGDKKKSLKSLDKVKSELDKAAKKGVMHKNKAARKKSQAAQTAKKAAGVTKAAPTNATKPKTAPKAAPKTKATAKPAVKKTPVKKPVTKKAPAKKPTAKK